MKLLLVSPEGSRLLPDWMKTSVSVWISLLEACVRLLLVMMSGADTTPAAMATPVAQERITQER